MGAVTMQMLGIPTLTLGMYVGIILLFILSALYVGIKFEPLTAEEIQGQVEEVKRND